MTDRDALIASGRALALWIAGRSARGDARAYADELRGAAMLALVRAAATFAPERGSWPGYLSAAVRRACAAELRRLSSPVHVPADVRPELKPHAAPPKVGRDGETVDATELLESEQPSPDEQAILDEEVRQVREAVGLLPRRDRRVVELRYLDEEPRTMDATAAVLGITRQRVCQIEARAFERLRGRLG